jgi:hypothetical protein
MHRPLSTDPCSVRLSLLKISNDLQSVALRTVGPVSVRLISVDTATILLFHTEWS